MAVNGSIAQLKGAVVTVEAIANAISVPAGVGILAGATYTTESEVWFGVAIDKQPWSLGAASLISGTMFTDTIYPPRYRVAATYGSGLPCLSLYLPMNTTGLSIANMAEARQCVLSPGARTLNVEIINNHATDTATATIYLFRVWR